MILNEVKNINELQDTNLGICEWQQMYRLKMVQ